MHSLGRGGLRSPEDDHVDIDSLGVKEVLPGGPSPRAAHKRVVEERVLVRIGQDMMMKLDGKALRCTKVEHRRSIVHWIDLQALASSVASRSLDAANSICDIARLAWRRRRQPRYILLAQARGWNVKAMIVDGLVCRSGR